MVRDDMKWPDGRPITVQDYLIAFELESNPQTGVNEFPGWYVDGEPIVVGQTGEWSVRSSFPGPDRTARGRLGLTPLPDHVFGDAYRRGGAEAVNALWAIETDPSDLVFNGAGFAIYGSVHPTLGDWVAP